MACFDNILALREYCDAVEPTGYYLDDFGITKDEIESLVNKEYDNAKDFVDKKIAFCTDLVVSEVVSHFRHVEAKTLIQSHRVGIFNKNLVALAGGNMRGIHLHVDNVDNFLEVNIAELSLLTDFNGTIAVSVYDLTQAKLLDTYSLTAVAGQASTVYPQKLYKTLKSGADLFFGYDTTGINSYKTTIRSGLCCGKTTCSNSIVTTKGAELVAPYVNQNLTALTDTAGMSILYSVSCDHKSWLCAYLKQLALVIGYKVSAETMLYGTSVSERNNNKTFNRDVLQNRFDFYEMKYRESLDNILKNISIPTDNICFSCKTPVRHRSAIP